MGALLLRVLSVSAGCSAVVDPLLLAAPRLCKKIAARSFYLLFLLLALRLMLPAEGYSGAELPLVLRHELTHIRRWDVAYKLALSLACAVSWFNPLVWLMDRAARRNLELRCDDDVGPQPE